ncbi:winged helix DNA-binding domain-containing protein [Paenibacillus lupini]|uniref:winged helix DNA-binding domain-containing protein n=1 Tax=Paenibacillus lupini TaxID=1450204 RepID=UPI00141F5B28|nr:winged helix DNA-binding domain-containing protein [Paenibacillus lupini]NIK21214.1 hypothetical protein [Paenibacillus lupini]
MTQETPKLSALAINRALLARQMLLSRSDMSVLDTLEWFIGLQAQAPNAPYYSLWTRLNGFEQSELSTLIQNREAVRIALMRSTLHLVSAKDCLLIRPWVQPVLERGLKGSFGKALAGIDLDSVALQGRKLVEDKARTFSELGKFLADLWPGINSEALAAVVRNYVPLIQIPPRGLWGESGQATHTSSEVWLGQSLSEHVDTDDLILRYLAAYGPATVKDMQAWCGLTRLKEHFEKLRPQLLTFRDEQGNELFDLPDAPRPNAEVMPPARFLSEFDQMLLGIVDRSRVMDITYAKRIFTANGILRATILLNGFIAGIWKIERERNKASLLIEPFRLLTNEEQAELIIEGEKLIQFTAPGQEHDIRFS